MKPKRIVISAFGSYGGKEIIDFDKVETGIFLITGDTGSGKTTIFDAITFALFNETSGGKRDSDMMRSQYADDATPTFVEFTFQYAGESYSIRRNPNYRRMRKRRNKAGEYTYTTELTSVELTLPDGRLFPGKTKETNDKIQEILGVNASQFTQISMIAQGEFLKLLHASSRDRKEIFTRIFDTQIYGRIQYQLKERSKELEQQLSVNALLCEHEIANVSIMLTSLWQQQWQEVSARPETGLSEIIATIAEIIDEIKQELVILSSAEAIAQNKLLQIRINRKQANEWNQLLEHEQKEKEIIQKTDQYIALLHQNIEKETKQLSIVEKKCQNDLPKLQKEIMAGHDLLPQYGILTSRQEALKQKQQEKSQREQELEHLEVNLAKEAAKLSDLTCRSEQLVHAIIKLPEWEQQEKERSWRQEILLEMNKNQASQIELKKKWNEQQVKLKKVQTSSVEKKQIYEEKNNIFITEQAGILAARLADQTPCPVCGSRQHPHKAALRQEALTAQQVEQAKKEWEQAEQELNKQQKEVQKEKEAYEAITTMLLLDSKRIFGSTDLSNLQDALNENEKALKYAISQKEHLIKQQQYQNSQSRRKEQLESVINTKREERAALLETLYKIRLSYETQFQALQELSRSLPFETETDLKKHIEKAEHELHQLEQDERESRDKLQQMKQDLAKTEGTLQEKKASLQRLQQQRNGHGKVDTKTMECEEKEWDKQRKELGDKIIMLNGLKSRNEHVIKNLDQQKQKKEKLVGQYQLVEGLNRVANGNLNKQAHIDLQTYVQRRYFKRIIQEANQRLIKMSDGGFQLRCREMEKLGKQGEVGLDLDVYDFMTDQIRDIKTLSGGESFLAALSMALGMSDVLQRAAGRVHLDTMFIDEGFGYLDEESRVRAIRILHELAGETKLVGIISHVTELKEQLERRLVVTKTDHGSKLQWEV
jgi:exonuclease SbcC